MKILHLSLKEEPFEVMVTGEKTNEFRAPTKWIISRLYNKDGTLKHYDLIKFVNGYGSTLPNFTAVYNGFNVLNHGIHTEPYSNGFHLEFLPAGTIDIKIGEIIEINNLKTNTFLVGDFSGSLSVEDCKWLVMYGYNVDKTIDLNTDDKGQLDYAITQMFIMMKESTRFDADRVEKLFWERIRALANYR